MTLSEVIEEVKEKKPSTFKDEDLLKYLNELEGTIQVEVMGIDPYNVKPAPVFDEEGNEIKPIIEEGVEQEPYYLQYTLEDDKNTTLLVPSPFCNLYILYLSAQIDFYNKEFTSYNNTLSAFKGKYEDYVAWYNNKETEGLTMSNYY